MEKLLLFDIDFTLIERANCHVDSFAVAFKEIYGVYGSIFEIDYSGMTDRQTIKNVMLKKGLISDEIDAKIEPCMDAMCRYFKTVEAYADVETIAGVPETIAKLYNSNYLLGLVTGNLEPIAHGKLSNCNINQFFKLGGFGGISEKRADLVEHAKQKAFEDFGFTKSNHIYLFGDTPNDIFAGKTANVISIGVTTGNFTEKELFEAGADKVIGSVGNYDQLINAIT